MAKTPLMTELFGFGKKQQAAPCPNCGMQLDPSSPDYCSKCNRRVANAQQKVSDDDKFNADKVKKSGISRAPMQHADPTNPAHRSAPPALVKEPEVKRQGRLRGGEWIEDD